MPNIQIIYEDEDLLVIDKPSGITVNKADTTRYEETVQEWAESKLKIQSSKFKIDEESDFFKRGGVVHRLDKETSGVLVIAKNPEAFTELQRQFKERITQKTYHALAHGKVIPETGEISATVGRLPWNRKRFGVISDGRDSITYYKCLYNLKDQKENIYSFLELHPKTGRTHQIRVHLKFIGHPVFSDFLYAGRKTARNDRKILERVFLHASMLKLIHPSKKTQVELRSDLPEELSETLGMFTKINT